MQNTYGFSNALKLLIGLCAFVFFMTVFEAEAAPVVGFEWSEPLIDTSGQPLTESSKATRYILTIVGDQERREFTVFAPDREVLVGSDQLPAGGNPYLAVIVACNIAGCGPSSAPVEFNLIGISAPTISIKVTFEVPLLSP